MSLAEIQRPSMFAQFWNGVSETFRMLGAAARVSSAIENHTRPTAADFAILGIDPKRVPDTF